MNHENIHTDTTQKHKLLLDNVYSLVLLCKQAETCETKWEIKMDDLKEQIEFLKKKKTGLMDQIGRIDRAIAVLTGDPISSIHLPPRTAIRRKRSTFQCMDETIKIFNQNDYLTKDDVQRIMESKGINNIGTLAGKNHLNTTLTRLVERQALSKTQDEKYFKTEHWNGGAGYKFVAKLKSLPSVKMPTIGMRAIEILTKHGSPMHYTEIMNIIESDGTKIGGKDPKSTMTAHLYNTNEIRGIGGGVYALKKWEEKNNTQ